MAILLTGGLGFIGSHACVVLLQSGYDVTILDNLSNSQIDVLDRIERICGKRPYFVEGDIRDAALLAHLFAERPCEGVIHFAGLKSVGESQSEPLLYYDCNLSGTLTILKAMQAAEIKLLIFSSSATVYGDPAVLPAREDFPRSATTAYGRTKLFIEDVLQDILTAWPDWSLARLRYFNPVGAHESGLIGENPHGIPNNLMPYIARVAAGELERLFIFGGDYPTPDGTAIRDFIHVMDLAEAHVAALGHALHHPGLLTLNLGTGVGYSVLEMVKTFMEVSGRSVPYTIVARRPGDVAVCYADPSQAVAVLGWRARRDLRAMCADTWRWQQSLGTLG